MQVEVFKSINGYGESYEVSNLEYPEAIQAEMMRAHLTRYDGIIRDSFDVYLKGFDRWGCWAD